MNKLGVAIKVFTVIGAMVILDKLVTKSYKDGVKRGIEIGEYGKTLNETINVED